MSVRYTLDVFQLVTSLAVVVGLVLVVIELRQAREIAVTQQNNQVTALASSMALAEAGEILPEALAKSCEAPESLTGPELIAMNGYFLNQLYSIVAVYRDERVGISGSTPWRDYAHATFPAIFFTSAGRAWWRGGSLDKIPSEIIKLGDEILGNSPKTCFLDRWRDLIATGSEGES